MNHHEVRQMIKEKQLQDMAEQHRALSMTLAYMGGRVPPVGRVHPVGCAVSETHSSTQ